MSVIDKFKLAISWVVWPITYGVMFLISLFTHINVHYEDDSFVSARRPLIIVSNHRSIFDPWFISYAIPFKILFGRIFPLRPYSTIILSEKNVVGRFFKTSGIMSLTYFIYNTIPLPDGNVFEQKIEPLIKALNDKQSIMIFPEGKMASEDLILDFKKGVVRLHELTGAQILPVAIRYDSSKLFSGNVHIAIGKPFSISEKILENSAGDDYTTSRNFVREKVTTLYDKIVTA